MINFQKYYDEAGLFNTGVFKEDVKKIASINKDLAKVFLADVFEDETYKLSKSSRLKDIHSMLGTLNSFANNFPWTFLSSEKIDRDNAMKKNDLTETQYVHMWLILRSIKNIIIEKEIYCYEDFMERLPYWLDGIAIEKFPQLWDLLDMCKNIYIERVRSSVIKDLHNHFPLQGVLKAYKDFLYPESIQDIIDEYGKENATESASMNEVVAHVRAKKSSKWNPKSVEDVFWKWLSQKY